MAYLGKEAVNRSTGTSKDSFSGDGSTTAFRMSKSVLHVFMVFMYLIFCNTLVYVLYLFHILLLF